jgi:hypothetical protein
LGRDRSMAKAHLLLESNNYVYRNFVSVPAEKEQFNDDGRKELSGHQEFHAADALLRHEVNAQA